MYARISKINVVIVTALAIVGIGLHSPAQGATHHVKARVCASAKVYNHLHSKTARQCKRQGWYYEKGTYPTSTDPWTFAPYTLVYGPSGRLWVDTAGFYTVPNVR